MLKQIKKPFKITTVFVVPLIFIALMIFLQFYDVIIIKKVQIANQENSNQQERSVIADNLNIPGLSGLDMSVDFNNLDVDERNSAEAFLKFRKIQNAFIPSGVPEIYGEELDISFDNVQDAINKVKVFGPTYGRDKITLSGNDMNRYKKIGASIACEYCCGVATLTREDGTAACGCAHSIMMRGLSAYLIKNHPEMSDEDILAELIKWKITYFPKQTLSVVLKDLEEAGEKGIATILEEFPDFLPQMVGGC